MLFGDMPVTLHFNSYHVLEMTFSSPSRSSAVDDNGTVSDELLHCPTVPSLDCMLHCVVVSGTKLTSPAWQTRSLAAGRQKPSLAGLISLANVNTFVPSASDTSVIPTSLSTELPFMLLQTELSASECCMAFD